MRHYITRALIWLTSAFCVGIISWVIFTGLFDPVLFLGENFVSAIKSFPSSILYNVPYAIIYLLLLMPVYLLFFTAYEYYRNENKWLSSSVNGLITTVFVFAFIPAIMVAFLKTEGLIGYPEFWQEFSRMLLILLFTLVNAVLIPRLLIPMLKSKNYS